MKVGSKNPALFSCTDGSRTEWVVVKFREILLRQRFSSVGEVVASLLAGKLGFYHAEPVIVDLPANLAEIVRTSDAPEYANRIERSAGLNFGSVFVGPSTSAQLPSNSDEGDLQQVWAELFCFDFLIQNFDRMAGNPNYLQRGNQIVLIDHEQAFRHLDPRAPGEFSASTLELDPFFRHVAFPTFNPETDFQPFFERLSKLSSTQMTQCFSGLPVEWLDERSLNLEKYLFWVKDHSEELCEQLSSILQS